MVKKPDPYVLVTTQHRGVFFGKLDAQKDGSVTLAEAQNCVYWSQDVKGFLGLASHGPTAGCRITRPAPKLVLYGVTSVTFCSPEAVAAWKATPWK